MAPLCYLCFLVSQLDFEHARITTFSEYIQEEIRLKID